MPSARVWKVLGIFFGALSLALAVLCLFSYVYRGEILTFGGYMYDFVYRFWTLPSGLVAALSAVVMFVAQQEESERLSVAKGLAIIGVCSTSVALTILYQIISYTPTFL